MRKDQSSLLSIFFIFFVISVTSIAFIQNSFSQSDKVDIIKEIHASELRVRDHIDEKITHLDAKIDKNVKDLNDKYAELKGEVKGYSSKIEGLSNQLNSLDARVNAILITIITGGGSIVLFMLSLFIKPWRQILATLMRSTPEKTGITGKEDDTKPKFTDPTPSETDYPQGTGHEQPQLPH